MKTTFYRFFLKNTYELFKFCLKIHSFNFYFNVMYMTLRSKKSKKQDHKKIKP